MGDIRFTLTIITTIMSTYFNRDTELENFLEQYNDEFPQKLEIDKQFKKVLVFVDNCNLGEKSRAWQKADLLTLLVEVHKALFINKLDLDPNEIGERLRAFYKRVDLVPAKKEKDKIVSSYHNATAQATNDRSSRIERGKIMQDLLQGKLKN